MSIAYVVENIPSSFLSLDGVLCVVISVVQPEYNLLLVPCLPVPLQTEVLIIPEMLGYFIFHTGKDEMPHLQCNVFQN